MSYPPDMPQHRRYKTVLDWAGALEEFAQTQHDAIEHLRECLRIESKAREEREAIVKENERLRRQNEALQGEVVLRTMQQADLRRELASARKLLGIAVDSCSPWLANRINAFLTTADQPDGVQVMPPNAWHHPPNEDRPADKPDAAGLETCPTCGLRYAFAAIHECPIVPDQPAVCKHGIVTADFICATCANTRKAAADNSENHNE